MQLLLTPRETIQDICARVPSAATPERPALSGGAYRRGPKVNMLCIATALAGRPTPFVTQPELLDLVKADRSDIARQSARQNGSNATRTAG